MQIFKLMMSVAVVVSYDTLMQGIWGNTIATLGAIASGGGIYVVAILLIGGITKNEIESIPKIGKQLAKVLAKVRLIG